MKGSDEELVVALTWLPEGGVVCVIELTLHSELYAWQVELPCANAVLGTISANTAAKVAIRFICSLAFDVDELEPAPTMKGRGLYRFPGTILHETSTNRKTSGDGSSSEL